MRSGYFLTRSLMFWFWDIYCSPADRTDPRASPLRGNLANLPPAFVATCEFDPLRDEGIEYAEALATAGVPVEQLQARGHIHSSLMMVDVVITGVSGRAKMAEALRGFAGLPRKLEESEDALADRGERRRGVSAQGRQQLGNLTSVSLRSGCSRALALLWRFGLLWRRPLRRNPVCRRQRGARPHDEFVGLVEQPLRHAPECEINGLALLRVIERRKRLALP